MIARFVLGCVGVFAWTLAVPAQEPKETKLKPTLIFRGTHSAIRYETFDLISTEVGWKELWKRHRGEEYDPLFTESEQQFEVDFETHYVVLVCTGDCDACAINVRKRGDDVVVGFKSVMYQIEGRPFGMSDGPLPRSPDAREIHQQAKKEVRAPYAFVVLPKPVKTVVIEQDSRSEIDAPPKWKFRFLFPTTKDN